MFCDHETLRDLHAEVCLSVFQPLTPMGKRAWRSMKPFVPGEEEKWQHLLDEQAEIRQKLLLPPEKREKVVGALERMPDLTPHLELLWQKQPLELTQWYQLKTFLWQVRQLVQVWVDSGLKPVFFLGEPEWERCDQLLKKLNPGRTLTPSFWLDDSYDERLKHCRKKLRRWKRRLEEAKEAKAEELERKYGIRRNRLGEWVVERHSPLRDVLGREETLLCFRETAYDTIYRLQEETEPEAGRMIRQLEEQIAELEQEVSLGLTEFFADHVAELEEWMEKVARVDLQVSRIRAAETWQGTKPEWAREELEIRGGFHPAVANLCKEQGREITIIDCTLRRGVTVLFGPNMGGKTVALKTIGLIVFLAQWGFFVPAASCRMPLFSWVASLIGDQQEIKRNLSSFGAEVVRLKDWIERSEAGLLLLDEIGRGTNPVEGSALAQAVTCHLVHAPHYTVHVTHYQEVLKIDGIAGYRVAGFSRPDDRGVWEQVKWEKLLQELMDYRLIPYRQGESIPHEALWIAERLGLCPQVIADAKRRVRGEDRKWKQN